MKRILLIILVILVPLGVYGFWPIEAPTTAKVERTFTIDAPLLHTFMRLSPPSTVRKIVVLGDSKYLGEEIEDPPKPGPFGLGLGEQLRTGAELLTNKDVERRSILTVETNDSYIGQQIIRLQQESLISRHGILSQTKLIEPKGRLLAYDCTSRISGEDGNTIIKAQLTMTIRTRAPRLFGFIPKRRVRAAAELRLKLLEEAFREVIGESILPETSQPEGEHAAKLRQNRLAADWRKRRFAA